MARTGEHIVPTTRARDDGTDDAQASRSTDRSRTRAVASDVAWDGLTAPFDAPGGLRLHPVTHLHGLGMLLSACDGAPRRPGLLARCASALRVARVTVPQRPEDLAARARDGRLQIYAILDGHLPVGYARLAPVAGGVALEEGGLSCLAGIRNAAERAVHAFAQALGRGEVAMALLPHEGVFAPLPAALAGRIR